MRVCHLTNQFIPHSTIQSLKVVIPLRTVIPLGFHTALLETDAQSHTGISRYALVSLSVLCRREHSDVRVLHWFLMGSLCGVYWSARKEWFELYLRRTMHLLNLKVGKHLAGARFYQLCLAGQFTG